MTSPPLAAHPAALADELARFRVIDPDRLAVLLFPLSVPAPGPAAPAAASPAGSPDSALALARIAHRSETPRVARTFGRFDHGEAKAAEFVRRVERDAPAPQTPGNGRPPVVHPHPRPVAHRRRG
jgi:hypothetical protein